jgi:hypothetical protein
MLDGIASHYMNQSRVNIVRINGDGGDGGYSGSLRSRRTEHLSTGVFIN